MRKRRARLEARLAEGGNLDEERIQKKIEALTTLIIIGDIAHE